MNYRQAARIEARERELAQQQLARYFREMSDDSFARLFGRPASKVEVRDFEEGFLAAYPDYYELSEAERDAILQRTLTPELNRRGKRLQELLAHYRQRDAHHQKPEGQCPP